MALNPFFLQGAQSEQRLTQDLIRDKIDCIWILIGVLKVKVIG